MKKHNCNKCGRLINHKGNCLPCNYELKHGNKMRKPKNTYIDEKGYKRKFSNLEHRQIAYNKIYLPNKSNYPLPFNAYQIHHKDENKKNNHHSNLQLVTREEHKKIHGIYEPKLTKEDIEKVKLFVENPGKNPYLFGSSEDEKSGALENPIFIFFLVAFIIPILIALALWYMVTHP